MLPMICIKCGQWSEEMHFGECVERCCGAPLCMAKREQAKAAHASRVLELTASREPAIAVPDSVLAEYLAGLEREKNARSLVAYIGHEAKTGRGRMGPFVTWLYLFT